tara:strand:+ start:361 stop:606 length:246 start_codon:yes stop_codon:yes gene_type:complete
MELLKRLIFVGCALMVAFLLVRGFYPPNDKAEAVSFHHGGIQSHDMGGGVTCYVIGVGNTSTGLSCIREWSCGGAVHGETK